MSLTLRTGIVSVCYLHYACYRKVLKKYEKCNMKALIQTNKILIMLTGTSYFLKGGKTLLK
jgi:hypothetical protein